MELKGLIRVLSARMHGAGRIRQACCQDAAMNKAAFEIALSKRKAEHILRAHGHSRKESARIAGEMYTQK